MVNNIISRCYSMKFCLPDELKHSIKNQVFTVNEIIVKENGSMFFLMEAGFK